jgi:hypothetical protein
MRDRRPENYYAALVLFLSAVALPFTMGRSVLTDRVFDDGEPATLYAVSEPLNQIQASPEGGVESFVVSSLEPPPSLGE